MSNIKLRSTSSRRGIIENENFPPQYEHLLVTAPKRASGKS